MDNPLPKWKDCSKLAVRKNININHNLVQITSNDLEV